MSAGSGSSGSRCFAWQAGFAQRLCIFLKICKFAAGKTAGSGIVPGQAAQECFRVGRGGMEHRVPAAFAGDRGQDMKLKNTNK